MNHAVTLPGQRVRAAEGDGPWLRSDRRPALSIRAVLLPILCCLPYLAIPIGQSTNVPAASVFSLLFVAEVVASRRLLMVVVSIVAAPSLAILLHVVLGYSFIDARGIVTWWVAVMPLGGLAAATAFYPRSILLGARIAVGLSSAYVLIQGVFILSGTLPFVSLYDLPGYFSVPENASTILSYIKRPFGWFPEPSFMAGTLALALISILLIVYSLGERPSKPDYFLVTLFMAAVLWGQSGSAIFAVPALLVLLLYPSRSAAWRLAVAVTSVPLVGYAVAQLLVSRNASVNYSWTDRLSSIVASFRYFFSDPGVILIGTGRSALAVLFANGQVSISGLPASSPIPDIFSVVGRIIVENGVLIGLPLVLLLAVTVVRSFGVTIGYGYGMVALFAWLVIAGITITYDTASWIYGFPGVALGVLLGQYRQATPWEQHDSIVIGDR